MLSDTLSEAIEEIERYQREMPDVYDYIKEEINQVKEAMRKLQIELDTPPVSVKDGQKKDAEISKESENSNIIKWTKPIIDDELPF